MLKSIFSLPADLYKNRRLVMKLAKMILRPDMQVLILEPSGLSFSRW